jgi:ubiquinone biosynthesis protein UbiJ
MSDVDIESVVAALQERVDARRLAGDYPIGMELQLESEFEGMMRAIDRHEIDTGALARLVQAVVVAAHDMKLDAEADSRVPGGSSVHLTIGRVVKRQINPLAESVRDLGMSVAEALGEMRRLFEAQSSADERQLLDAISGVLDRLAVIDHLVQITIDLEQRIVRLESERGDR